MSVEITFKLEFKIKTHSGRRSGCWQEVVALVSRGKTGNAGEGLLEQGAS